jgi:hypothetical protein
MVFSANNLCFRCKCAYMCVNDMILNHVRSLTTWKQQGAI